jgi:hypothetical protein
MPAAKAMSLPPRFAAGAVPTAVNDIVALAHSESDEPSLRRKHAPRTLPEVEP